MSVSIANRHFVLHRLHSLFGVLPVGGFLVFHLWENSQSRFGMAYYNEHVVGWLQGMNYLLVMEVVMIALPLLLHLGYGLAIIHGGRTEWRRYPYLHSRLYGLQRVSGVGILAFLLLHVGATRIWGMFDPAVRDNLFVHLQQQLGDPLILGVYLLGLLLAVFHLCNGLWTFAISWGLVTDVAAQRRLFRVCMGLMLPLMAMGVHGLGGFLP